MERRRASSVNVNALQVDGGPGNPRHADRRASRCRRSFWKQRPVCGLRTVVEHAGVIDGEPEEGTGQAGPASGGSSSFIRTFGPIDRPGWPEAVPIKVLVVDLLQDLRARPSCWEKDTPKPQIKDAAAAGCSSSYNSGS